VLAIALLGVACAAVEQRTGWNELSHLAQIRAFAHGTPIIDRYGAHSTGDKAFYHGHYYGDKAPGLALLMVPIYSLASLIGVVGGSGRSANITALHVMVVFACVIPFCILLALIRSVVDRHDPGRGGAVALMLGAGTLLLPFATVLFSHDLSTTLGFAAFWLLERRLGRGGHAWIAAGGILAGLAVSTEYPLALLAALLVAYVWWQDRTLSGVLAFVAGCAVGLVPLLLYDWWAFGSPLSVSYSHVAANAAGVFGLEMPRLRSLVALLVSDRGLLVVTPITAAGLAGIAILYREGRRGDALVAAAVAVTYLAYNTCYYLPFGGRVPGPRFLITLLPFLARPVAAAYRRAPLTTLALAALSAATMVAATLTDPEPSRAPSLVFWWRHLLRGQFQTPAWTVAVFAGCLALIGLTLARRPCRPRPGQVDLDLAIVALVGWVTLVRAGTVILGPLGTRGATWSLVMLVALLLVLGAVVWQRAGGRRTVLVALLPLVALGARSLDGVVESSCLLAAAALLAALSVRVPRRASP
jgi:hypothetical protein